MYKTKQNSTHVLFIKIKIESKQTTLLVYYIFYMVIFFWLLRYNKFILDIKFYV